MELRETLVLLEKCLANRNSSDVEIILEYLKKLYSEEHELKKSWRN